MKIILTIFALLTLLSCNSNSSAKIIVLNYDDFGPQIIAYEVIGMGWWQWEDHGDSRPKKYDIKVVIYKDINLEKVKSLYPTDSKKEKDYRYLEYRLAMKYLDSRIEENVEAAVTKKLLSTKKTLLNIVGE